MAENQESNEGSNAVASGNNADKSVAGESGEKRKKTVEKKRPKHVHVCEVRLLDGTELVIEVEVCMFGFSLAFGTYLFIQHA